jgi:3',5'-cyclic AMP phosphodiesterase CpdA
MNVLVSVFANGREVSKRSYHDLTQGRVNRLRPGKREKVLLPGIHDIDELLD